MKKAVIGFLSVALLAFASIASAALPSEGPPEISIYADAVDIGPALDVAPMINVEAADAVIHESPGVAHVPDQSCDHFDTYAENDLGETITAPARYHMRI